MKFYLLHSDGFYKNPKYLGEAESMQEAKEKFRNKVYGGKFMVSCDNGIDPLYTDKYGIVQVNMDEIKEQVQLFYNNGSMENVPKSAKIFWWEGEELLLDEQGREWHGNYDLTPELLADMLQYLGMEQDIYNTMVEMDKECGYELRPLKPEEYIEMCTKDRNALTAFNFGLELDEDEFLDAEYVWFSSCDSPRCSQYLCEYIDEALGNEYFCAVFNKRYALNEGKIVRR